MALLDADMFTSPISVPKAVSTLNKRKSIELRNETCKKRLLDQLNIHENNETGESSSTTMWPSETEIFETQFFEQVDRATAASSNTIAKSALVGDATCGTGSSPPADNFTDLSQFFENTDFEMLPPRQKHLPTIRRAFQPLNTEIRKEKTDLKPAKEDIPMRPLPPSTQAYNLTQFFNDDIDDEEFIISGVTSTLSSFPQSSQIFLEAVREATVLPETQNSPHNVDDFQKIYKSAVTAAEYLEMQRDMIDANEDNLNDDNCVDPELSQAYKSTQYRHELEKVFNNYEDTLCAGLDELVDADGPLIPEDDIKPIRAETVASDAISEIVSVADDVDWETTFNETPVKAKPKSAPLITPTVLVQQRLSNRKNFVSSITPPVSRTSSFDNPAPGIFVPIGPFFGLPAIVKTLIRDYKGITNLYGRSNCPIPQASRNNFNIFRLAKRMSISTCN